MHGVIVSSILLPGALAALIAGILADRYGRTRMIAIGSVVFGIGAALETASFRLAMFIVGRLIKGAGEGIFLSTVYVHVCEICPAKKRGIVSALPQFLITLGLVMGFFISYGTASLEGSISWRLPIAIQAFLAFSNATLCSLVPPSPRWLQAKGRSEDARAIVAQLGLDDAEQAELLSSSASGLEHSPNSTFWENIKQTIHEFREAFSAPFRTRTIFGCFLMAMQQFSGIDGVLYYAPILLQQAGISSSQASFLASGVSALLIMAVTIPATLFADRWGRKTSTLVGGTLIFVLMLLMGSLYATGEVHADHGAGRWVVIVSIYLFAVVFSVTWAIGIRSFLIESLPRKTRSSAASLGQGSNWCDETHPRCGNCVKHGVACDFEHPALAEQLAVPETPTTTSATSPSFCDSPVTNRTPPTPVMPAGTPVPLKMYRQVDPPSLSTATKDNRMMELKLLHHYTTITCKTLLIADPMSEAIFRDTVPGLAFGGANFLADAILAVSALHMRSAQPQDQALVRASHAYMASSLSEYSDNLSKGINSSNAEALFLTATLIAFQSTASRIFMREDGGDTKDRSGGYTLPLSWFHSFQGVKTIVATSWQWLRNSGIVVPIIQSQPALDLNMSSEGNTFFGSLLDGMEDELTAMDPDPETRNKTRQGYQHAVAVLNWAHKIPLTGAPIVFLATVSRRYMEVLQARRPRALAILASFFGMLKSLDSIWWLKGIARREVMGILSLFDPDDQEWWSRLQWPVRMAVYDGDVIPSDVWGADWTAGISLLDQSSQTSGGFVSHIELLSQMTHVMQSMPHVSAETIAETAYETVEAQITAQDLMSQTRDLAQETDQHEGHDLNIQNLAHMLALD
ncbi:hypothetical protein SCARD494_09425 [Seiridium cardinale]